MCTLGISAGGCHRLTHARWRRYAPVAGAVGAGANYLTVAYLRHACPTPAKLRATGFTLSTVSIIGRIIVTSIAGLISLQIIVETILLAPVVISGGWLGARFFRALPGNQFDRVFRVFLLVVAISVIVRGIIQIT